MGNALPSANNAEAGQNIYNRWTLFGRNFDENNIFIYYFLLKHKEHEYLYK